MLLATVCELRAGNRHAGIWYVTADDHDPSTSASRQLRFCLRRAPAGDWLLYTSWEDPPSSDHWRIDLLRAPEPEHFDISTAQPVIAPADAGVAP